MCGIAGFCSFQTDFTNDREKQEQQVRARGETIRHRGPDDFGTYVGKHVEFTHTRLAEIDPENGKQPMTKRQGDYKATIVYNGEIYNTEELRKELMEKGMEFSTTSDTEVVLAAYMCYGRSMVEK